MGEVLPAHLTPLDGKPPRPPGTTGFMLFALLGIGVVAETADGTMRPAWLSWAGLAVVCALYAGVVLLTFRHRLRPAWVMLAALAVVVTAMAASYGGSWRYLFPLTGVACGIALYGRAVRIVLAALTVVTAATVWARGASVELVMAFSWGTFSMGLVVAGMLHLYAVIGELRRTRRLLAEAAVAEERLRFARDLHDLLGHTLSVIVVKAEAVRRLARRDPAQAERQAGDIETVGRQALSEVREAVTGYRRADLAGELARARDALAAAGIEAVVRQAGPAPEGEGEVLLGWVVREGVTNVIRHSGATRAEIEIGPDSVTVRDDGRTQAHQPGPAGDGRGDTARPGTRTPAGGGSGLRGLAERLARAGGHVEAGPLPQGGFELSARLTPPG
ncbi:MAG: two-component system sensor kinase [Nonomuraea muscovyensis]|nr:two-component system sensor kinase [Nonomuraea muscovyensis]